MLGVSDHHQKSSATAATASVGGRSSQLPHATPAVAVDVAGASIGLLPHAHHLSPRVIVDPRLSW